MASLDRKQRVLWSDNGTIVDVSQELNGFRSATKVLPIVAAQDALYIGCEAPFAHKFFDVAVVNAVASVVSASLWNGSAWRAVVDLIDGTAVAGATMAQDGQLSWSVDPDYSGWSCQADSTDVDGLADGPRVFDLYWLKLTFSGNHTAGSALAYIGDVFSDDTDLIGYYPDMQHQNLKTAFGTSSKTNWQEQHVAAGEEIVRELRRRNIVKRREQIMDGTLLNLPSIHKTAAIIYGGLGANYATQASRAIEHYRATLDLSYFEVDENLDGKADAAEKRQTTGFASR